MNMRLPIAAAIIAYCQMGHTGPAVIIIDPDDFPASLNSAIQAGNNSNDLIEIEFPGGTFSFDPAVDSATPIMQGQFRLRAQGNTPVIISGNGISDRGFEIGNGAEVTFDSLTIQGFNNSGIRINSGSQATINNSTISGNSSAMDGGGIYNAGDLTLTNSIISGNTAVNGGGIYSGPEAGFFAEGDTLLANTASFDGGGLWGGGDVTLDSLTISGNTARAGGGIFAYADQLLLDDSILSGNTANLNGGGLYARTGPGDDRIELRNLTVLANSASFDGGGLSFNASDRNGDDRILIDDLIIQDNLAGNNGGGIDVLGGGGNTDFRIRNCHSEGNGSSIFGDDLNVIGFNGGPPLILQGCSFVGPNSQVRVENPDSDIAILDSVFEVIGRNGLDNTGTIRISGTIFDDGLDDFKGNKMAAANDKAVCNDFGFGTFQSQGNNISPDNSCNLNQSGDLSNTDAMVGRDSNGKLGLLPGSPAIDAALTAVSARLAGMSPLLPCGYKDANGLGRPQDGDGDGVFECDIGSVEVQGGPDIIAAQSSAYFDTGRNGEGLFVELIGSNLAIVSMFTFAVDGNNPTWLLGVGNVVGNSIVVDEMSEFDGGVFGTGFNPANITSTSVGGLSLNLPTCESGARPGKVAFQANPLRGFSDLLVNATRLSTIIDCSAASKGASVAGRSGSFFDPARSGEGIFVQWLTNGGVVVIWYTYDNQGNRLWIINDGTRTTVNGSTVTATMLFPSASTAFGSNFNASEVALSDWGTLTLEYQPGCNSMAFGYNSSVSGFGSGNYNYVRLSNLDGTSCDL